MTRPIGPASENPIVQRRRELRSNLTPAEAALWRLLKQRQLQGRKFRRQYGIGPYIVDFCCPSERLAIELDGAAHDSDERFGLDRARGRFLEAAGVTVLRLENRLVFEEPDGVLALIAERFKTA